MDTRFQHIFLKVLTFLGLALSPSFSAIAEEKTKLRVNSELFDIGIAAGIISIEDFPTEFVYGANITFKASEDFFLQYNYFTSDISQSAFEGDNSIIALGDRTFSHFDLLVGYNIFQGEFFSSDENAHISHLYVLGGVGETDLGNEENFSYTIGLGYQIEFFRKLVVRFDYRDYIFDSSLVAGATNDESTLHNSQITIGAGYLF